MKFTSGLALWMLLTAAASLELYDELPPDNIDTSDTIYQEHNSLDTGPMVQMPKPDEASEHIQNILITKLLKILQTQGSQSKSYYPSYRPNWDPTDLKLFDRSHSYEPQLVNVKYAVMKRVSNPSRTRANAVFNKLLEPTMRPQPKWKIKKGKAIGSQMVCYFKLCAFRYPT